MKITEMSDAQLDAVIEKQNEVSKLIEAMATYSGKDEVVPASVIKESLANEVEQEKYFTNIKEINEIVDGFKPGDLITMSGISGNGKTELLISFTKDFIDKDLKVLWISFEVNPKDFMSRFGDYDPIFFMPRENVPNNLTWVMNKIKEAKAKYGIQIAIIDHLHFLIDMGTLGNKNISHLFGGIIRQIKTLALKLDVTIFLVCHLNKTETKTVPDLVDLRDSSFTYQEADTVLIIHRENTDENIDTRQNIQPAVLRVAKNRWNGYLGLIKLVYDRKQRRYFGTK
jgi:replicative DNA helicase